MITLISVMELEEIFEKMKNCKDISDTLLERCVAYARWNFASWQVIMKLVATHKENVHLIQRILKQLRDEPEAILRYLHSGYHSLMAIHLTYRKTDLDRIVYILVPSKMYFPALKA